MLITMMIIYINIPFDNYFPMVCVCNEKGDYSIGFSSVEFSPSRITVGDSFLGLTM